MNASEIINLLKLKLSDLELSNEPDDLVSYGQDWTRFHQPNPSCVVFPKTIEQVQSIIKLANEQSFAVVPSGGRTGYSAGATAINGEVVLSMDKMRSIIEFNPEDSQVKVEAGVITEQLQNFAEEKGLFYPVDFASSGSSQIGGNIATNAGGIRVLRYGLTRNYIAGLKVVTGTGEILELNSGLIKNATGYDIRHLFIGSEGTLGIIVEATIQLVPQAPNQSVMLLALSSLDSVMKVFSLAKSKLNLSAYEFFTDKALKHVTMGRGLNQPFEETAPCYVLCEFDYNESTDEENVLAVFEQGMEEGDIVDGIISQSNEQAEELWQYREGISESISHLHPYKNDISVRVSKVSLFMNKLNDIVKVKYPEFELVWFGHIGDGNLHLNILKPNNKSVSDFKQECEIVNQDVYGLIKEMSGSVSAEHGVGMIKKPFLKYTRSKAELKLFEQIKSTFDPNGVLNPGKLV